MPSGKLFLAAIQLVCKTLIEREKTLMWPENWLTWKVRTLAAGVWLCWKCDLGACQSLHKHSHEGTGGDGPAPSLLGKASQEWEEVWGFVFAWGEVSRWGRVKLSVLTSVPAVGAPGKCLYGGSPASADEGPGGWEGSSSAGGLAEPRCLPWCGEAVAPLLRQACGALEHLSSGGGASRRWSTKTTWVSAQLFWTGL